MVLDLRVRTFRKNTYRTRPREDAAVRSRCRATGHRQLVESAPLIAGNEVLDACVRTISGMTARGVAPGKGNALFRKDETLLPAQAVDALVIDLQPVSRIQGSGGFSCKCIRIRGHFGEHVLEAAG